MRNIGATNLVIAGLMLFLLVGMSGIVVYLKHENVRLGKTNEQLWERIVENPHFDKLPLSQAFVGSQLGARSGLTRRSVLDLQNHTRIQRRGVALPEGITLEDLESIAYKEESSIKHYIPFPTLRPIHEFIDEWNPDNTTIPDIPNIAEGSLERFNYMNLTERKMAMLYRQHEVPFMLVNVPEISQVVRKWTQEYITKQFGNIPLHVTYSQSNHFMYYSRPDKKKDYKPPTEIVLMKYTDFLVKAQESLNMSRIDEAHYYLQLSDGLPNTKWISSDIPIFQPRKSLFINDPAANRGINCRFGNRGVIAEAHYDGGRNYIAMLKGAKRYILAPPSECKNLYIHPRGHPEARHSYVDWSNLDYSKSPDMLTVKGAQVILRAGEVMYLPSYWFHYIVSLDISIQCNTRSGLAIRGRQSITDCGFYSL